MILTTAPDLSHPFQSFKTINFERQSFVHEEILHLQNCQIIDFLGQIWLRKSTLWTLHTYLCLKKNWFWLIWILESEKIGTKQFPD